MIIIVLFFNCSTKKTVEVTAEDNINLELDSNLKSILINYVDSIQGNDSTIKVFYLILSKLDDNYSYYKFTAINDLLFIENHPPISYTKINSNYILFGIAYNKQLIGRILHKQLENSLKEHLKHSINHGVGCWEIITQNDSVIKVNKSCQGHLFLRTVKFKGN
ncbi:MAG: hypothetical protein Q8904_15025 [Bacteroidota bacterium]|nr:hypothetical protein [Bacteroidota bacterium]